uniref:Uncharacterized protein n=2 Tax=Schizaphis graminum TaxID=13262 RepID=A0A2S2P1R1_SCHGA
MVEYKLMEIKIVQNSENDEESQKSENDEECNQYVKNASNFSNVAKDLTSQIDENIVPADNEALLFVYIKKFFAKKFSFFETVVESPKIFCLAMGINFTKESLKDPKNYKITEIDTYDDNIV